MDNLCRTGFHAYSAIGTKGIIDRSMEIIDYDRFIRTFLLAYLTAYAAVFAYKLCRFSVISGRTHNIYALGNRLYSNKLIRTYCRTLTAGAA